MNILDVLVVVGMVTAAIGGWRLGLLARMASWAGLTVGFLIAVRLLPTAVDAGGDPRTRLVIAVAVLLGGALLGQGAGMFAGARLRQVVAPGPFRSVDRGAGAGLGVAGVVISLWLLLPSIAVVPGWPAQQAHGSAIAQVVDSVAPPPPDAIKTVRRLVGGDEFPRVFEALRPAPDPGPPPAAVTLSAAVQARVAQSTVKVEGIACRRLQQGSGFAAGPDLIITNAHVVAGEDKTEVVRPDGKRLRATTVGFDPDRDLAVLRVPGLRQVPLPLVEGKVGLIGAVFGHPDGQDTLRVAPAAVRQRVEAVGRDLYDKKDTRRQVFILAATLHQGDSGAAVVDHAGEVVGVAFAIAPDRSGTSYALTSAEVRPLLAASSTAVDTGPCLREA